MAFVTAAGAPIAPPSPTPRGPGASSVVEMDHLDRGHVRVGGNQVVHQRRRPRLAVGAVRRLLEQHGADPLLDPAADLAVDDLRVDDLAGVLGDDVADHVQLPGHHVDLDRAAVRRLRPLGLRLVVPRSGPGVRRCTEVRGRAPITPSRWPPVTLR